MSLPSRAPPLSSALAGAADSARELVRRYHERTKHQLAQYARGPDTLDWDAQPAPFRRFLDAETVPLPRLAAATDSLQRALARPLGRLGEAAPLPISLPALGVLFELSLGITAWKTQGPDRWAVRANPSSGNLHPVEGYLFVRGASFLESGVYHYGAEEHALERRARWDCSSAAPPRVWLALSSVMWREAWKYGERAFRYCQLDVGHAVAALRHAAALLGWRLREDRHVGWETLHRALGLDRAADFASGRQETEREEAEVLLEVESGQSHERLEPAELRRWTASSAFCGRASAIDSRPMYSWPTIQEVAAASRWLDTAVSRAEPTPAGSPPPETRSAPTVPVAAVILNRRSAQRFDPRFVMERATFGRLLRALSPSASGPLGAASGPAQLDLILFVHRVQSLEPGVYLLPRLAAPASTLQQWLGSRLQPRRVAALEAELDLWELATVAPRDLTRIARSLHCHQDIAANGCFAVGMLADLEQVLHADASGYRNVLREAGGLGQILYLRAEAEGLRGTGIGCFFDDAVTELLGIGPSPVRPIYHFSVGKPIHDPRIETQGTHGAVAAWLGEGKHDDE